MPAIEIAGLCLPLKPQKEKCMLIFNYVLKNFQLPGAEPTCKPTLSIA